MKSNHPVVNKVSRPPSKPVLSYDGECPFCVYWVNRWRKQLVGLVELEDLRIVAVQFSDLPVEQLKRSVHLIETDGSVSKGAEAVFRAFAHTQKRLPKMAIWAYKRLLGFEFLSEILYNLVAQNRIFIFSLGHKMHRRKR